MGPVIPDGPVLRLRGQAEGEASQRLKGSGRHRGSNCTYFKFMPPAGTNGKIAGSRTREELRRQ